MSDENVIASRVLVDSAGLELKAKVYKPEAINENEWMCKFTVEGFFCDQAFGVDSIQALIMAFEGLSRRIREKDIKVFWNKGEDGRVGFPRLIPTFFGSEFMEKLEKLVDEAITQHSNTLINKK